MTAQIVEVFEPHSVLVIINIPAADDPEMPRTLFEAVRTAHVDLVVATHGECDLKSRMTLQIPQSAVSLFDIGDHIGVTAYITLIHCYANLHFSPSTDGDMRLVAHGARIHKGTAA